ncbi:capsule gland specific secretory protein [Biomphalaria pfeifferi]|uniref:Capsule gland specific secretory protein n=1 Tax=Biomphalaria pfeifferi TaxID=112525 RepID=A0AAD8AZL6_BIOPF|nr:capsule gland specific secretory protein [Biomphalaria pfeifferi]
MRVGTFSFFLTALVLLWIHIKQATGFERITTGLAGVVCEEGFRKCSKGPATCINEKCQCPEGYNGKGNFICFPKGYYHLSILSDPYYHTLTGDAAHMYFPCRYPVAHFITYYQSKVDSTCHVQIHAFNKLVRGKYYIHGFDVALSITDYTHGKRSTSAISYRKTGSACNGRYTYIGKGSLGYRPDGPWDKFYEPLSLDLRHEIVRLRHDPVNNFAYLEVKSCGFRIDFRAYDRCSGVQQSQVPGLAVSVKENAVKSWLTGDHFVTFVPGFSLKAYAKQARMPPEHALLLSVLESTVDQNQPDGSQQCKALYDITKKKNHRQNLPAAFEACFFMMSSPLFVHCYDDDHHGNRLLPLFSRCVRSFRNKNRLNCEDSDQNICRCAQLVNRTSSYHEYNRICCRSARKS